MSLSKIKCVCLVKAKKNSNETRPWNARVETRTIDQLRELGDNWASVDPEIDRKDTVQVNVLCAALNHRDVWMLEGKYPVLIPGMILGADASCSINGSAQIFILRPGTGWRSGSPPTNHPYAMLGQLPFPGTFCERLIVPKECLYPAPKHLSTVESASLPTAGLTAYRSVFTVGKASRGQAVVISGIGGGVAGLAA
jgi:zinc-binding alcohol dehydrogenase/oxidoreductase